jgi:hypothetical protein
MHHRLLLIAILGLLGGCSRCLLCFSSMHMLDDDQLRYVTEYLVDHDIAHYVDGLDIYFRPWEFDRVVQGFAIPAGWVCFSAKTPEDQRRLFSILAREGRQYRKYPESPWNVCFPQGGDEDFQRIRTEYLGDDIPFSLKVKSPEYLPRLEELFRSYGLPYRVTQFQDGMSIVWKSDKSQFAEIAKRAYEIQGDPN